MCWSQICTTDELFFCQAFLSEVRGVQTGTQKKSHIYTYIYIYAHTCVEYLRTYLAHFSTCCSVQKGTCSALVVYGGEWRSLHLEDQKPLVLYLAWILADVRSVSPGLRCQFFQLFFLDPTSCWRLYLSNGEKFKEAFKMMFWSLSSWDWVGPHESNVIRQFLLALLIKVVSCTWLVGETCFACRSVTQIRTTSSRACSCTGEAFGIGEVLLCVQPLQCFSPCIICVCTAHIPNPF